MKRFLFIPLVLFLAAGMFSPTYAAFVEGLEDIPLPDGLSQIENGNLSFGNEEIRLIEVYLTAESLAFEKISRFYLDTLPQMGWQLKLLQEDRLLFEREGETLEINNESASPLVIRLTVKSKL